ncbi:hypothetical protein ACQJBY_008257 [Aegilops geniculata]
MAETLHLPRPVALQGDRWQVWRDTSLSSIYKPQTVSLGPFHHDDKDLKPMEEHKLRAVHHLLRRDSCKTTLSELVATMEKVGEELQDAYMELGDEWRGKENRGKFLEMMIIDGCFLLEVMRTARGGKYSIPKDYKQDDPVFSWHGIQHIKPFILRDMLLVENQLPLRLLEKIVTAESGRSPSASSINSMVLKFLEGKDAPEGSDELGLHPLDIYRRSQLKGHLKPYQRDRGGVENTIPTANAVVVRHKRVVPDRRGSCTRQGSDSCPARRPTSTTSTWTIAGSTCPSSISTTPRPTSSTT